MIWIKAYLEKEGSLAFEPNSINQLVASFPSTSFQVGDLVVDTPGYRWGLCLEQSRYGVPGLGQRPPTTAFLLSPVNWASERESREAERSLPGRAKGKKEPCI